MCVCAETLTRWLQPERLSWPPEGGGESMPPRGEASGGGGSQDCGAQVVRGAWRTGDGRRQAWAGFHPKTQKSEEWLIKTKVETVIVPK